MRYLEVKFRRVKNLGNYESEEITLSAAPTEGVPIENCIEEVKTKVLTALGLTSESKVVQTVIAETKEEPAKPAPKKRKPAVKKEEVKKEEVKKEEPKMVDSTVTADPVKEEVKPAKGVVVYDRKDKRHLKLFKQVLDSTLPTWNDAPETKIKAKDLSLALEGKPFYSKDGQVLPEVIKQIEEALA